MPIGGLIFKISNLECAYNQQVTQAKIASFFPQEEILISTGGNLKYHRREFRFPPVEIYGGILTTFYAMIPQ